MAVFSLPLAHSDFQQTANVTDALHSLQRLDEATSSIFARLLSRIGHETERCKSMSSRVTTARSKISNISLNRTRATTIFSTAKHPASSPPPNQQHIFKSSNDVLAGIQAFPDAEEEVEYVTMDPQASALSHPEQLQELNGLYQRLNPHATDMQRVEILMEEQGLGPLPSSSVITSSASLLLFNSTRNPYKEYERVNNLMGKDMERRDSMNEKEKDIHVAPTTLVDGDMLPDVAAIDLMFKPELGEMNSLALPDNLALPNLANLSFGGGDQQGIAPSQFQNANQLSLPAIEFQPAPSATETSNNSSSIGMFAQLKMSMDRRQAAISGKKDRQEKKRDTIALMQNPDTFRATVRSSLTDAGIPIKAEQGDSEDSDSDASSNGRDRVFSDDSYQNMTAPTPKTSAVSKAPKKVQLPPSPKKKNSPKNEEGEARRGSLWDSGNKDLARMLSSKSKEVEEVGSDDSDWDE
ncbi:hypothetical protein TL16_g12065 [Triparma laevis f. inornata]|uniref:WASH1 WAHD domain-containing protein n=1 Tax=Triparma laevis f. inornata TaxID=1714386 RepID=A0A9W7BIS8_9STRA|nr:hypothetical protein TL16_g12065 [Triparma laevis f. inornata]